MNAVLPVSVRTFVKRAVHIQHLALGLHTVAWWKAFWEAWKPLTVGEIDGTGLKNEDTSNMFSVHAGVCHNTQHLQHRLLWNETFLSCYNLVAIHINFRLLASFCYFNWKCTSSLLSHKHICCEYPLTLKWYYHKKLSLMLKYSNSNLN